MSRPKGCVFSLEHRANLSKALKGRKAWWIPKGEKAYNWQGGKTAELQRIRNTVQYKEWREAVFKRDRYRCLDCGLKNERGLGKTLRLNADHIYSFAKYPRLRFELENGRTLCEDCHRKTPNFGVKANWQFTKILARG